MAAYDARNLHLIDLVDAELTVYLQPGYCTSVSEGVHEELDNSLLRYVDDQEAVLLAYRNVRVVSKQALLTSWLPYLTIDARADLVLFKPIPGKILVGRVHKLTDGMLGLLVLGGINASITAEQMPDGFAYDKKHICWVPNGDHSKAILMGDYVACRVLSTPVTDPDEEELLFNLDATLRDPEAGLCAQQTQLQQQKRSHIAAAAAAAAAKKQQRADGTPKSAHKASKKKHKDKKEHKKERRKDKEHNSASKDKKRKRDEGDQQPDGKQKKQKQQQPSEHHTQQQQQQPSNGLPPVDVSGNEPVTPAAPSSKKDKQHRGKGSSHKPASSSHKKHGSSSHKKHGSSSHKKHKDKQQDKDSSKKDRGEGKKSSKKDKRKDGA